MPQNVNDSLDEKLSGARLTIDLDALADNWADLARQASSAQTAAVVKADGYGVGLEPAGTALARAGCKTFFVALPSEGLRLRDGASRRRHLRPRRPHRGKRQGLCRR